MVKGLDVFKDYFKEYTDEWQTENDRMIIADLGKDEKVQHRLKTFRDGCR